MLLKVRNENGTFEDVEVIKGQDGAIQYTAGTGIEITTNNTINCTASGAPNGGTTGQVLMKKSNADNDTKWASLSQVAGTGNYNDLNGKPSVMNSETTSNTNIYSCSYINNGLSSKANSTHTHTATDITNLTEKFNNLINSLFPVGKVEMFYDNEDHSNYLGFTWARTMIGRMPLGINANDTDFNVIGKTGGEKAHTLTIAEMPSHNHSINGVSDRLYMDTQSTNFVLPDSSGNWLNNRGSISIDNTGGNGEHNNMPPYEIVAFWKRIE